MSNYDNENAPIEEPYENSGTPVEAAPAVPANRNFLLALGVLSGLLLVVTIGMVMFYLSRPRASGVAAIQATNNVVLTANAGTALAATETRAFLMTPSVTPTLTETPVPPTAVNTQVLAVASATPDGRPVSPVLQTMGAVQAGTLSAINAVLANDANPQTQTAVVGQAITLIATTSGIIPDFNIQTQTQVVGQARTLVATTSRELALANAQTQNLSAQAGQTQTRDVAGGVNATASALPETGFADEMGLPGLFGLALGMLLLIFLARTLRLTTTRQP